jgi:hypothetical protein
MNPETLLLLIGTWLPWFQAPLNIPAPAPGITLKAELLNVVPSPKPARCIDEVLAGQMEPYPVSLCEDR